MVKKVARRELGWRLTRDAYRDDWDVLWTDSAVPTERLASMKKHQKINHFPGMFGISRKDYLARNLNKMKSVFPTEFDFFPRTWLIPTDLFDFKTYCTGNKSTCFIVKPEASSQGKGIYLIRKPEDLVPGDRCVVQSYVHRPYLIDGLKFDLRIYVLVTGCDPLRIYIHEEGLTRLATEEYEEPRYENMGEVCMHLTNYAVNKMSEKFEFNTGEDGEEVGHKRSLAASFQRLEEEGWDIDEVWRNICDLVVKTLCSIQPNLAHTYKSAQPDDVHSGMCFELLGFDILLDSCMKPWLLEVNHSPSFTVDTPLDDRVKTAVIGDTLKMLGLSVERRRRLLSDQRQAVQKRNWLAKTISERRLEKQSLAAEAQVRKDEFERTHLGGFTLIYPVDGGDLYETYMETAGKLWESWTCLKSRSAILEFRPSTQDRTRKLGVRLKVAESLSKAKEKIYEVAVADRLQFSTKLTPASESPPNRQKAHSRPQSSFLVQRLPDSYLRADLPQRPLKGIVFSEDQEDSDLPKEKRRLTSLLKRSKH